MRKRPPTVRACSLRARKLAKEGEGDSRKGKALAACAATPRRSRPRPKVAPATKSTCRRRAKALQSGKVGRSDRSKVAYRLTLCRRRKPSAKRAHRANPAPAGHRMSGYPDFRRDAHAIMEHVGATGVMKDAHGNVLGNARIVGKWATPRSYVSSHQFQIEVETPDGTYTGRGAGHGMLWNGRLKPAKARGSVRRCNPSASTVKAKVVGSKTAGKVFRRRFLLVQLGPSRLVWVEASPTSSIGPIVNRASADAVGSNTDDRSYPLSEDDRKAIVAAFNAYVTRRGTAW